jgi:hypothetical protein
MGGLIVAAVCFAYLAVSFTFARKAYRHEYQLVYGSPAPQIYGGRHGHDKAREVALREASQWLAMWPFYCAWAMIEWLIAHGIRQGWVEVANEITQMQTEVDRLAAEQDPSAYLDLKHGPLNEACEQPDPWLWEEPKSLCSSCIAVEVVNDRLRLRLPVSPMLGDQMIRTCRCGENKIKNLGRQTGPENPEQGYEIIRTSHPGIVWTGARWITQTAENARDCNCSKCWPSKPGRVYER